MRYQKELAEFERYLIEQEKSQATVSKYLRDVRRLLIFLDGRELSKELMVEYKNLLAKGGKYTAESINTIIASINSFCKFLGKFDCLVKTIKVQRKIFYPKEKEITKEDYIKLLHAADGYPRLKLIMETICSTGIRVSELQYLTLEAAKKGYAEVKCKGKTRTILIPSKLKAKLLEYAKKNGILGGMIFVTKSGKPIDRRNIWAEMKALCKAAGVLATKVFPHNLRRLFAKTFYKIDHDISKLADVLGHSSINTTRIYIMTSGAEHRRKIERLGLVT